MKNVIRFLSVFILLITGCTTLSVPTTSNPSSPSTTGTNKPTNSPTVTPPSNTTNNSNSNSGNSTIPPTTQPAKSNPTSSSSTFKDPDNFKPYFTMAESDAYLNFFGGVARAAAKTSVSSSKTEFFQNTQALLATLPSDADMHSRVNDKSPRNADENRNVFVGSALIFSIKKEEDGDFHVIIGDTLNGEKVNLMNVEVAGLPKDTTTFSYKLLKRTRRQLYEKFPDFFTSNKKTFNPRSVYPLISIRGSLFFDTHHEAGAIGSGSAKPNTVWEIHPATYIEFK